MPIVSLQYWQERPRLRAEKKKETSAAKHNKGCRNEYDAISNWHLCFNILIFSVSCALVDRSDGCDFVTFLCSRSAVQRSKMMANTSDIQARKVQSANSVQVLWQILCSLSFDTVALLYLENTASELTND